MRSAFSLPGIFRVLKASLILSLVYSYRSVKASETNAFDLCTPRHCEDCSSGEFSKCSNGAISSRCGDLCGCCHSCVQLRDFGESCGAQLAVRTLENFENSRFRVSILATTSCGKGLICNNFVCEKLREEANVEINDEDSFDLRTNSIRIDNPYEFYRQRRYLDTEARDVEKTFNDEDLSIREIKLPMSIRIPWPIVSIREMLSIIGSHKNEISSHDTEQDLENSDNILFDPSGHLINLAVGVREFQMIYGHDALADFNLLIGSIEKNQPNSLINERDAKILCDRFEDVLRFVNSSDESGNNVNNIGQLSASLKIENREKNENQRFIETTRDPGVIAVLRNFVLRPDTSRVSKSRSSLRKYRKKRELEQAEKSKVENRTRERQREIDDKINREYGGISVYDIVNKTPRQMEDFDHWLMSRKIRTNPEEKSRLNEESSSDEIESVMNIRIAGIPRMRNFDLDGTETGEKNDEVGDIEKKPDEVYENYDDSDIFVGDANTDIPKILTTEDENLANFSTSEMAESEKNNETDGPRDIINDDTLNVNEKREFFDNNYEFIFPENPVTLENDYYRDVDIVVNETFDEFKAQLDRIETRAIVIENAVFDMMDKIDINERSMNNESRKRKIENFEIAEPEVRNNSVGNDAMHRRRKILRSFNENSTNPSESKGCAIEDTRSGKFHSNRTNRQWRTIAIQTNLSDEAPKISGIERDRNDRSEETKIIETEVIPRRNKSTRDRKDSDRRRQISLPRRSGSLKFFKDIPRVTEQKRLPIFLSSRDLNDANFYNYQHEDPRLFSRESSSLQVTSDSPPRQRTVWPLNIVIDRAQPADRGDRKSEEEIRIRARNINREDPIVEESIILLETQIPRSSRPGDSLIIADDRQGQSSMRRDVTRYEDNGNWNWEHEKPSLNLFAVDGEKSEFEMTSSRSSMPETLALAMKSSNAKITSQESREAHEGYTIYPSYLDYSVGLETRVNEDEPEMAESSLNLGKSDSMNSRSSRKKRNVQDDVVQGQKFDDKIDNHEMMNLNFSDSNTNNTSEKSESSARSMNLRRITMALHQNEISDMKNSGGKRSRRSVRMVDWLRAAQEYHEGLRQVRNAAIKTWLASRAELNDTDLTNVKLFTRELPPYLERYQRTSFEEDFDDDFSGEMIEEYPTEIRDPEDSMTETSETFTDIVVRDSMSREINDEPETHERSDVKFDQVSSSSGPRKFTIITNGSSVLRIEEMSDRDDDMAWLEDQTAQYSTGSEVSHDAPIIARDGDYFDHMYESFDADDEDFDYDDPNSMLSGWLDEIDIIESSRGQISENTEKLNASTKVGEQEDPASRLKRDTPLFLFKVKGKPQHDVLVWPSNWKYLIDRHLRLNRSGDAPQTMSKGRSYTRLGKIDPKYATSSANTRTNVEKNSNYREDEIPSSSEMIVSEQEKIFKDSSVDLDVDRMLQKSFDRSSRQSRRKNGSHRSNSGNYK